jgi:hypothetical protein
VGKIVKSKLPSYFIVENWLKMMPSWKAEMEVLKSKLQSISGLTQQYELVPIYAKGQKNETILNQVIERLQIKQFELPLLEMRMHLLDVAMQVLPPEEQKFVELKYGQKLANSYIMNQLVWSERTFYIKRKEVLKKLYDVLGGEDAVIWFASGINSKEVSQATTPQEEEKR